MGDGICQLNELDLFDLFFENLHIVVGNKASILHGTPVKLSDHYLIEFIKGILCLEVLLIKFHSLDSDLYHEPGLLDHVLDVALPTVNRKRDVTILDRRFYFLKLTRNKSKQVSRERFGGGK